MINKKMFINESKLGQEIQGSYNHIVNLKEDYFEYCNGMFLVNCTYDLDLVIQKLFKAGAISNYKDWKSIKNHDFKDLIECKTEVSATLTPYLKYDHGQNLMNVFKVGDNFVSYSKKFVDIFKNVEYKGSDSGKVPMLRVYGDGNLIGVMIPVRDEHDLLIDIMALSYEL